VSYRWSWEADYAAAVTHWANASVLDLELGRFMQVNGRVLYPTLLDSDSPGRFGDDSYTSVGNTSCYLYVNIERTILRHRVLLVNSDSPLPPPPPPPPAPAPAGCSAFRVSGAGLGHVNGVYRRNGTTGGVPLFQMDSGHQLYRFQGVWKLAHWTHPDQVWYMHPTPNTTLPSSAGWRVTTINYAPAPAEVLCADGGDAIEEAEM